MADRTQVRELLRRFQHPKLQDTVKAIEFRAEFDGITYSEAANHLTSTVSKMSDYQLYQKVSGIQASEGKIWGNSVGGGPHKYCLQQRQQIQFTGNGAPRLLQELESPDQRILQDRHHRTKEKLWQVYSDSKQERFSRHQVSALQTVLHHY